MPDIERSLQVTISTSEKRSHRHKLWKRCAIFSVTAIVAVFLGLLVQKNYCFGLSVWTRPMDVKRVVEASQNSCRLNSTAVWSVTFPKLLTESAVRMVHVNQDGIKDVIIGFATGGDGYQVPDTVCDIYFDGVHPCFGGVLALDGVTGRELWRTYTKHEVFALNCNADLNGDGISDCVAAGRAGVLLAVSGRDGRILWNLKTPTNDLSNFYTAQILHDLNQDGVPEIIVSHGGDPLRAPGKPVSIPGLIFVLDGRNGTVLRNITVPDKCETYYSLQFYEKTPGSDIVLIGTGGETHGGSLWAVGFQELLCSKSSDTNFKRILSDDKKGVMAPPVLVDITEDGIVDIIIPLFNSTVIALDGSNFRELWRYSTPNSETYSTPAAGYFNNDNIPDFFINYSVGPGYPIYYYTEATVLDGATGRQILTNPIRDAIAVQSSPLTLSIKNGSDFFLYWISGCSGKDNMIEFAQQFRFAKGTKVNQQSRSNFCQLRFKTDGYSKLYALNQHTEPPGILIYESESGDLQSEDTVELAKNYLQAHPEWRIDPKDNGKKIGKRHVGAHDSDGMQRLISTGSLTDPLFEEGSIDLIFATYWFYPTKTVAVLEQDQKCIDLKMENEQQRFLKISSYFGMDHDAFENTVEEECLTAGNRGQLERGENYRDLFNLKMGSMTVHRKRIFCAEDRNAISPMYDQRWAAYMGNHGDSLFMNQRPR